jgi:O-antigen/teichoic acid export membrane protein
MLIKTSGTLATFALSMALARVLGISEFGIYSLVVSAIMVLSIPIRSGIHTLATRETSKALTDETPSAIGHLLGWSNRLILIYTVASFIAVLLLWAVIGQSDFLDGLLIAIISVGTLSLTLRNAAILRGFKRFAKGTSPDILIRPVGQLALLAVILLVITWPHATAQAGLVAFTGASIIACLVSVIWLRRELSGAGDVWGDTGPAPIPWRKALLFLTIAGGGQILFGHIDTLMLGALGEPEQVGAYRASVQISMLLIFILTVVNQVLQPNLVRLYRLKDISGMQKLVSDSSFFMFMATLVLGAGLMIFAAPLIDVTFGSSYTIASTALQILVVGQVLNVFFGSVGTILNMTGMEKEAVTSIAIAIIVNISLDLVLIPLFGMVGAASASALSIFVWNMISRHYVKTRVGIESSGVIHRMRRVVT